MGRVPALGFSLLLAGLSCLAQAQLPLTGAGKGARIASSSCAPSTFGANYIFGYEADSGVFKDAGSTPAANGDSVQQWNDLSGNGYNLLQSTSGLRPTLNTTGYNSHPAIIFNRSIASAAMATAADTVAMGTGTGGTLYVVGQMATDTQNNGRLVAYIANGVTADFASLGGAAWILRSGTTNNFTTYRGGFFSNPAAISLSTNYRFGSIFDGANETLYVNNVGGTPAANTDNWTSPGGVVVGSYNYSTDDNFWSGTVAAVYGFNTAFTSTNRDCFDNYMTGKWGT